MGEKQEQACGLIWSASPTPFDGTSDRFHLG